MKELDDFLGLQEKIQAQFSQTKNYGDFVFSINESPDEKIDVWVSGLLHGDEIQGLESVNHLMGQILSGELELTGSLAISLGNPRAAVLKQRFVERDLNRCFHLPNSQEYEVTRAQVLSPLARRTKFLIDLHQTVEACESAFFIIPDRRQNIIFAKNANASLVRKGVLSDPLPIVSFPADGYSLDGRTLTEVLDPEAIGISVELGQKGKSAQMKNLAAKLIEEVLLWSGPAPEATLLQQDVYEILEVIKNEPGLRLVPGLRNFTPMKAGDLVARSPSREVRLSKSGYILFPKYGKLADQSSELLELATVKVP